MDEQHVDGDTKVQESQQQVDDDLEFPELKPGDAWGESVTRHRADELEAILQAWGRTGI